MIEIKSKNPLIESIESRGEVMTAEEQRMKEERIAIRGQKIVKSGWSGKFDRKSNFPKKDKSYKNYNEISEIDTREEQYNKQNRELERRESVALKGDENVVA